MVPGGPNTSIGNTIFEVRLLEELEEADEILATEDAEDDWLELLFELPRLLEIEFEDTDEAELCEELANKLDEDKLTTELDVIMPKLLVEERLEDATDLLSLEALLLFALDVNEESELAARRLEELVADT